MRVSVAEGSKRRGLDLTRMSRSANARMVARNAASAARRPPLQLDGEGAHEEKARGAGCGVRKVKARSCGLLA
jgi:hypothetical protein